MEAHFSAVILQFCFIRTTPWYSQRMQVQYTILVSISLWTSWQVCPSVPGGNTQWQKWWIKVSSCMANCSLEHSSKSCETAAILIHKQLPLFFCTTFWLHMVLHLFGPLSMLSRLPYSASISSITGIETRSAALFSVLSLSRGQQLPSSLSLSLSGCYYRGVVPSTKSLPLFTVLSPPYNESNLRLSCHG